MPAEVTEAAGLKAGDTVFIQTVDNELRVRRLDDVVKSVQERLRPYFAGKPSAVDSLIEDRRAETKRA
ncbi:MAG: AbrB/MazE/SpoVT family DNA-binding domain-containing protein [Pseudomonadota bacterium]